jgi:fatty acid kinase fatty acid binding subunit
VPAGSALHGDLGSRNLTATLPGPVRIGYGAGMTVKVVTDSTAYLPAAVVEAAGLHVVPLTVTISGRQGREGIDVTPGDIARALTDRHATVTTSRPSPAEFVEAYRTLLDAGATGIVSIHLSARLSGTVESATLAAGELNGRPVAGGSGAGGSVAGGSGAGRICVVDARSAGMAVGFVALAACRAAAAGGDIDMVCAAARSAAGRTSTLFYVDTLDFLRRGGRISAASALVGGALSVKPILHMDDGAVLLKEKVRTAGRALARMVELAAQEASESDVDIAVQHLAAAERADALRDSLMARLGARVRESYLSEIGAALGAHTGPGVIGVAMLRHL